MTTEQQKEITRISQEFFAGFEETFESINNTGGLIAEPLSAYLEFIGFPNSLQEMPANGKHPQVVVLLFPDNDMFIPAGGDLKPLDDMFCNWFWS